MIFSQRSPVAGKAEAIAADDGAILQHDVVAQSAVLAHNRMGVGEEILANTHSAIDDDVRQKHSVVADLDVVADHHVGANMSARADLRRGRNYRSGMNARLIRRRCIEQIDGLGERKVRILAAQHAAWNSREVFGNDYG